MALFSIGMFRVDSSWNVMAHGDARQGKWRGNWWLDWVASTLHTTSEHGVSSITTADAHTSAASSRLNWRPRRFKWTRPFCRKTKYGFCACAITFQTHPTTLNGVTGKVCIAISLTRLTASEKFSFEHRFEICNHKIYRHVTDPTKLNHFRETDSCLYFVSTILFFHIV